MTDQIENAGPAGAIRVASAASAPPEDSATRVPSTPTPTRVPTTQKTSAAVTAACRTRSRRTGASVIAGPARRTARSPGRRTP